MIWKGHKHISYIACTIAAPFNFSVLILLYSQCIFILLNSYLRSLTLERLWIISIVLSDVLEIGNYLVFIKMADIHHMVKAASYNSTISIDVLKFLHNYVSVVKRIYKPYDNIILMMKTIVMNILLFTNMLFFLWLVSNYYV